MRGTDMDAMRSVFPAFCKLYVISKSQNDLMESLSGRFVCESLFYFRVNYH